MVQYILFHLILSLSFIFILSICALHNHVRLALGKRLTRLNLLSKLRLIKSSSCDYFNKMNLGRGYMAAVKRKRTPGFPNTTHPLLANHDEITVTFPSLDCENQFSAETDVCWKV